MGEKRTVIHVNQHLAHQVKIGEAIKAGFLLHGIKAEISHNPNAKADRHVVLGPWFALKQWRNHPHVLYIDRAYWCDPKCISVHWLKNGEKAFTRNHNHRLHPQTMPYKHGDRVLILCDYKYRPPGHGTVRLHPAEHKQSRSLKHDLDRHDIAIGRRTTALIDAAIHGLKVITEDPHSPAYAVSGSVSYIKRDEWLNNLAWHNWSLLEIENGDMWNALSRCYQPD